MSPPTALCTPAWTAPSIAAWKAVNVAKPLSAVTSDLWGSRLASQSRVTPPARKQRGVVERFGDTAVGHGVPVGNGHRWMDLLEPQLQAQDELAVPRQKVSAAHHRAHGVNSPRHPLHVGRVHRALVHFDERPGGGGLGGDAVGLAYGVDEGGPFLGRQSGLVSSLCHVLGG